MLGWGPMSSTALGLGRDPPLLGGLDGATSLEKGESATQTQSPPGVTPSPCPPWGSPGAGGRGESCGKRCSHAAGERMSGSAGMRIGALLGAKGIWEEAMCSEAQGAMRGTRTVHGSEGRARGRPAWDPPSPSAPSAAARCPSPLPVLSPTLSGGCFSSIPGELQPQSPSPAGTGAEEPSAVEGKRAVTGAGFVQVSKGKDSAVVFPLVRGAAVPPARGERSTRRVQPPAALGAFPCQPGHISGSKRETTAAL